MTPLEHALAYAARGWRVAPIPPGYKYPHGITNWQQVATTDPERISRYWTINPNHGVCIATGPGSGLWALDIDPDHGGDDSLRALEAAHGPLPDTVTSLTGGGGTHYLFTWPDDGREIRNNQSGLLGVGLDVRGEGGQIVVAPTVHPCGVMYAWEVEHHPFDGIAVQPAPAWLVDALTAAPTSGHDPLRPARKRLAGDPLPGDWWEAQTSWPDELARRGWTLHSTHHDAHGGYYELWTRPGKSVREGASASLYYGGSDVLKVFSTSAAPLEVERTYSLWGFEVAHEHGGDFEAGARAVRRTMPATSPAAAPTAPTGTTPAAETPEATQEDDAEADDWAQIDLVDLARAIREGRHERTMPTILAVEGHLPLFYAGRVNQLFGESGGGKSWLGLAAIRDVVRHDMRALFVDWEDNATGMAERLVDLGLDDDEIARVDYRNPSGAISSGLERFGGPYAVAVIDSTGEAMAAGGVDSNADQEVAQWFAIVKRVCRLDGGPAVIVIDHIPKDTEAPKSYAIGSQRKRAAVTGAAYRVDTLKESAKGRDGILKLTVAKDRHGNRPKGSVAAEVHMLSGRDGALNIELRPSDAQMAADRGEKFRPTVLMERVSHYLESVPGASQRAVCKAVAGKTDHLRLALECLVEEGYVKVGGHGYESIDTYREPVDNSPAPTAPPRAPGAPQGAVKSAYEPPRPRAPGLTEAGARGAGRGGGKCSEEGDTAPPVDNSEMLSLTEQDPL